MPKHDSERTTQQFFLSGKILMDFLRPGVGGNVGIKDKTA